MSILPVTRYTAWFSATAEITIRGTDHGLASDTLCIEVFVRTILPGYGGLASYPLFWRWHIDPSTYDVHIYLASNRHEVNVQLSLLPSLPLA